MAHEVSVEDVTDVLRETLPAGSPYCELVAVEAIPRGDDILAVLQLILFDIDPATGDRSVTDVKEQHVYFVPESCRNSRDRVAAFVRAWAAVLTETLTTLGKADVLAGLMPHELVHVSALKLARAETEDDFKKALRVKSRLGKLLATGGGGGQRAREGDADAGGSG